MNRETLQPTEHDAPGAADAACTRQPARGAWLIRAAVLAYLIVNAGIAYLLLASG